MRIVEMYMQIEMLTLSKFVLDISDVDMLHYWNYSLNRGVKFIFYLLSRIADQVLNLVTMYQ